MEREHWGDLFTLHVYKSAFAGQHVLPLDVMRIVMLYLDPVCIRHWGNTYPLLCTAEQDAYYQRLWCAHYSNFDIGYTALTQEVSKAYTLSSAVGLLQQGLDKVVQRRLDAYIQEWPLLLELIFTHNFSLNSSYLLLYMTPYIEVRPKYALSVFSALRSSQYRLPLSLVQRLYALYKPYITDAELARYDEEYIFMCEVITDSITTVPSYYTTALVYVYDNVQLATLCDNIVLPCVLAGAKRCGARKVLDYMYNTPLDGKPFIYKDVEVEDMLYFTRHLSLLDIVRVGTVELVTQLYGARTWADEEINAVVNFILSTDYALHIQDTLVMLRARLGCVVLDEAVYNIYYWVYYSLRYGQGIHYENSLSYYLEDLVSSEHYTITAVPATAEPDDVEIDYPWLPVCESCTITNGAYYLAITGETTLLEGEQYSISSTEVVKYIRLAPHAQITFTRAQCDDLRLVVYSV